MNKVYERTENGTTAHISIREGLAEINRAQMGGRREVREMSSITRTDFAIEYKDGRSVRLVQVDAPTETDEQPATWTLAGPGTLLHRFTQDDKDGRALCNKSFRPYRFGDGYAFKPLDEQPTHLYRVCARCEVK